MTAYKEAKGKGPRAAQEDAAAAAAIMAKLAGGGRGKGKGRAGGGAAVGEGGDVESLQEQVGWVARWLAVLISIRFCVSVCPLQSRRGE